MQMLNNYYYYYYVVFAHLRFWRKKKPLLRESDIVAKNKDILQSLT